MNKYKTGGWRYESTRHSLSAKGVKTKTNVKNIFRIPPKINYAVLPIINWGDSKYNSMLIHFTPKKNVKSILEHGLRPSTSVEEYDAIYTIPLKLYASEVIKPEFAYFSIKVKDSAKYVGEHYDDMDIIDKGIINEIPKEYDKEKARKLYNEKLRQKGIDMLQVNFETNILNPDVIEEVRLIPYDEMSKFKKELIDKGREKLLYLEK